MQEEVAVYPAQNQPKSWDILRKVGYRATLNFGTSRGVFEQLMDNFIASIALKYCCTTIISVIDNLEGEGANGRRN